MTGKGMAVMNKKPMLRDWVCGGMISERIVGLLNRRVK